MASEPAGLSEIGIKVRYVSRLIRDPNQPLETEILAFIAQREAAGLEIPSAEEVRARIEAVLGNVSPHAREGSANHASLNAVVVIVHKQSPPFFGVTTRPA